MKTNMIKKLSRAWLLWIFALLCMNFWSSIYADYQDWLYIWENSKQYLNKNEWKSWSTLFKAIKWSLSDKTYVDKYGEPIDKLLDEYLRKNNTDKRILFQILSSLNKDLINHVKWWNKIDKTNQTDKTDKTIQTNKNYDQKITSTVYDEDDPFWNAWSSTSKSNTSNSWWFKSDLREQNDELINKTENWKRYTVEDFFKDLWSRPWLRKTAEHFYLWWSQWWYLRSSYERHIRLAGINNSLFNDNDSDATKIEKIYNFVQDKVAHWKNVDPWIPRKSPESAKWFAQHKEYVSAHNALDKWEAVCEWWNGLYFDLLMHAWLKNTTIEIQEWEVVWSIPWQEQWIWEWHYHVLLNWKASDAYVWWDNVYSAPYTIWVKGRWNRNFNL